MSNFNHALPIGFHFQPTNDKYPTPPDSFNQSELSIRSRDSLILILTNHSLTHSIITHTSNPHLFSQFTTLDHFTKAFRTIERSRSVLCDHAHSEPMHQNKSSTSHGRHNTDRQPDVKNISILSTSPNDKYPRIVDNQPPVSGCILFLQIQAKL